MAGDRRRYPGVPLTVDEARIAEHANRYRVGDTAAWWSGEQWREDADADLEAAAPVPGDGRWLVARAGGLACKRWRREAAGWALAGDYAMGSRVEVDLVDVEEGVRGLADLFGLFERDRHACLVRGILGREPGADRVVRRAAAGDKDAWIAPHPIGRRALIVDVDKAPAPEWGPRGPRWTPTPDEARALVAFVVDTYLPRSWEGATVAYRWTSSAGLAGWSKLSLHLGLWLERPIYEVPLRRWMATWGRPVDPAIVNPVQPIYTAAPIFEGGPDPLEVAGIPRTGLVEGERDEVAVPGSFWQAKSGELVPLVDGPGWHAHEAEAAARIAEARRVAAIVGAVRAVGREPSDLEARLRAYARGALRAAARSIAGAAQGVAGEGRHDTLLREASSVGGYVGVGLLAHDEVVGALLEAFVAVAGGSRRSEGARAIKAGLRGARAVTREEIIARLDEGRRGAA